MLTWRCRVQQRTWEAEMWESDLRQACGPSLDLGTWMRRLMLVLTWQGMARCWDGEGWR